MINIQCKKCGYRFPFSTKEYGFTARARFNSTTLCHNCGQILIKDKKITNKK
jgi:hypothetical protein